MKVKRGTSEKYKEYPFKPCSQNGSVALPYSHSLSFHLLCNYSKLTIFNSFNFIAHEFSAGGKITRNFSSIQGLSKGLYFNTLQTYRKPTGKRRRFDGKKTPFFHSRQSSYHFESAVLHENHLKTRKNSAEILFLYPCFIIKEIMMYIFLFYQFDNSTGE